MASVFSAYGVDADPFAGYSLSTWSGSTHEALMNQIAPCLVLLELSLIW